MSADGAKIEAPKALMGVGFGEGHKSHGSTLPELGVLYPRSSLASYASVSHTHNSKMNSVISILHTCNVCVSLSLFSLRFAHLMIL